MVNYTRILKARTSVSLVSLHLFVSGCSLVCNPICTLKLPHPSDDIEVFDEMPKGTKLIHLTGKCVKMLPLCGQICQDVSSNFQCCHVLPENAHMLTLHPSLSEKIETLPNFNGILGS